jgi:hypothetical protein
LGRLGGLLARLLPSDAVLGGGLFETTGGPS